ncbi:MAG: hypothetical protein HY704_13665 [Gemmatimonadetes bacterium]|nr:hypothetical protein [Gemmatimonadota bacterium]
MYSTTSRFRGSFTRAGLVVAVATAVLAATPRSASAGVIICAGGKCEWAPGNCSIYKPLPSGYLCADIATAALRNPHLLRDGAGASFIDNGKTTPIMSDAADALLQKAREAGNRASIGLPPRPAPSPQEIAKLWKDFDAAFHSGDRRVSDTRLQSISKELGLPIETQPRGMARQ